MKIARELEIERIRFASLEDLIDTYKSDDLIKEESFYKDMISRNIILKQIKDDDIDNIIEQISELKDSEINSQMTIVDGWYNKMTNHGCQYWIDKEGPIEELENIRDIFGGTHVDVDTKCLRQMAEIVSDIIDEVEIKIDFYRSISKIDDINIREHIIEAVNYYNENNNNAAFVNINDQFEKINDQKYITNLYYEIIQSNILHHEILPFVKKYLPSSDQNNKAVIDELNKIIVQLNKIIVQL